MRCREWEIWFAHVKFEDRAEFKDRPVLIIGRQSENIIAIKMTGTPPRDSSDYALKHWASAGLQKETTARISKMLCLTDGDLIHRFGALQPLDIIEIQKLIMK